MSRDAKGAISERLRSFKTDAEGTCDCHVGWGYHLPEGSVHYASQDFAGVRDEAADEIERLREQRDKWHGLWKDACKQAGIENPE